VAELLKIESVCKDFGPVRVLDAVSFTVKTGEVHALVGENGAGKSTLIKILSGVHHPSSGNIYWMGRKLDIGGPNGAMSLGISTIHQELSLCKSLTVAENLFLGREPVSVPGWIDYRKLRQSCEELLGSLGIVMEPFQCVENLSIVEQQMIKIAEAVSRDARLLIMDEPTAALPQNERHHVYRIIRELTRRGVAILYVSHLLEEVLNLADRITVLRDGRVAGELGNNASQMDIVRLMVGRETSLHNKLELSSPGQEVVLRVESFSAVNNSFRDVSLFLRAGEILGITGLLGSGKSELGMSLCGAGPRSNGSLWFEGKLLRIRSPRHGNKLGIVMVPEERKAQGIFPGISVKENYSLPLLKQFATFGFLNIRKEIASVRNSLIEHNVTFSSVYQDIMELSGGNQQKVVLGRWIAAKPKVLVLLEPTRGIAVTPKAEIHRVIAGLAAKGMGVLLISSDLSELLSVSHRILVMREGRLVAEVDRAHATQEIIMRYAASNESIA